MRARARDCHHVRGHNGVSRFRRRAASGQRVPLNPARRRGVNADLAPAAPVVLTFARSPRRVRYVRYINDGRAHRRSRGRARAHRFLASIRWSEKKKSFASSEHALYMSSSSSSFFVDQHRDLTSRAYVIPIFRFLRARRASFIDLPNRPPARSRGAIESQPTAGFRALPSPVRPYEGRVAVGQIPADPVVLFLAYRSRSRARARHSS